MRLLKNNVQIKDLLKEQRILLCFGSVGWSSYKTAEVFQEPEELPDPVLGSWKLYKTKLEIKTKFLKLTLRSHL